MTFLPALAPALPYFQAAGALFSAFGALQQGAQQSAALRYNAAVAENDALAVRQSAEFEARNTRRRAQAMMAQNRAASGASGVTMEGSPLLAMSESNYEAELDALAIEYSGSIAEARAKSQAAVDRMQSAQASRAGYFGAGSALLTGASKIKFPTGDKS